MINQLKDKLYNRIEYGK